MEDIAQPVESHMEAGDGVGDILNLGSQQAGCFLALRDHKSVLVSSCFLTIVSPGNMLRPISYFLDLWHEAAEHVHQLLRRD